MMYDVRIGISILSNVPLIRKSAVATERVGMKGIASKRIFVGRCVKRTALTAPILFAIFPPKM